MKKIYLVFITALFSTAIHAQGYQFDWAKSSGGTNSDESTAITVDDSGNVYITGNYQGIADFDPGAGSVNLTSNGGYDVFIQKLDVDGNLIWAKSVGGSDFDWGSSISVDVSGNVYVTGYFRNTVDFDPGVDTFNLTSDGYDDVFILKLDSGGNFVWANSIGGSSQDYGKSIIIDTAGYVYVTGGFRSNTVDFDPGVDTVNLISNGDQDVFILKLDTGGNFIWAKTVGGIGGDYGISTTLDANGNVYIGGAFRGTADFDPGPGTVNLYSNGLIDVFILKLDANGNFIWAKSFGGSENEYWTSIAVDIDGNVYVTGSYSSTVDFDPGVASFNLTSNGSMDVYVLKLDANGNFVWVKSAGGAEFDYGTGISTGISGNVYVTGVYEETVDFNPGAGTANLTVSGGSPGAFILQLDTAGNFISVRGIATKSSLCRLYVAVDSTENVYITGPFGGGIDADPGSNNFPLNSNGGTDFFVERLIPCNTPSYGTDSAVACNAYTWIDGVVYTASTNASLFLTNSMGCDSIVTLDLTINYSSTGVDSITPDSIYIWIDGNTYTENNNTATFNIVGGAANGCDSLVALDLTFNCLSLDIQDSLDKGVLISSILTYYPLQCLYGKSYQGGLIFYVDTINATGFVAAPYDQSTGALWCQNWPSNTETAMEIGTGVQNTIDIQANCAEPGTAANLCDSLTLNGYTDWFLPSYYELLAMHDNLHLLGHGYFDSTDYYWSSSTSSVGFARILKFPFNGIPYHGGIIYSNYVRAARPFDNTSTVDVINEEYNFNVRIYPNPASNQLIIDAKYLKVQRIEIMDITGKKIKTINPAQNSIGISELRNGIYFIKLIGKEQKVIYKFIKN